jgi:hypothetical protein
LVQAVNDEGETIELPFIHYALIDNSPMILGTAGKDCEVYGTFLKAIPNPNLPFTPGLDDTSLEGLYTDYLFNWTLNLALYHLGNAGTVGSKTIAMFGSFGVVAM